MIDAKDPVQVELAKLSLALLGNRQASLETIDESEKLARVARDSRPQMPALRLSTSGARPAAVNLDPEITAKFRALRERR